MAHRTELTTEAGEPIKIIYPGRINAEQGADFRDAVIATNRGVIKGDIEIHLKSSDWRAHRHHRNPQYNQVILHVAMWHDAKAATKHQNGESIPTLALNKYIKTPINQRLSETEPPVTLSMPCLKATEPLATGIIAKFLDSAGEERFLAKATKFQVDLAQTEASQCLYQGIMGALGYSQNRLPFLELAHRVTLHRLESITQNKTSDEECLSRLQALLLGTAGLLPSQRQGKCQKNRNDKWIYNLERLWTSYHPAEAMTQDEWNLFRVRPNNSPIRRIAAMSYLILRYRQTGLFNRVTNMIKEVPVSQSPNGLEKGLLVATNGYWASHFDFGLASKIKTPTLLGCGRAADIIINVLLPFTFAWSKLTSQPELEKKTLNLYRRYPKLTVNTIERHMKNQLGISTSLVNSAQRQQGLIQIYNTLCTQGRCHSCPLSQLEAGNHI
ncbi:MAG: DUF2851 family protein [Dehalococcoidia bacterium]|nr:MAG: DUF2851 family protein [Dehalococcoidia bacterium]